MMSPAARRTAALVFMLAAWVAFGLRHAPSQAEQAPSRALVHDVAAVGVTVSDMDRAVNFYSTVLLFEKVSDVEVAGDEFERLQGVFGARARVVTMRLGDERLELTEYLTPRGRPAPADARSNDRSFQHVAIIVNDMEQAYLWLRRHGVQYVSPSPQRLPDWNPNAAGIRAFYFRDPDGHARSRSSSSRPTRVTPAGTGRVTACSSASTTPRSWSATPRRASASIGTSSA